MALALAMLAGCGVNKATPPTNYVTPNTLQGQVLAGRNYMVGATVKIYETQPTGVPSNGAYTGTAKLLQTLTTNATGSWSTSAISCSTPDQLYVTAEAGVPYASGLNTTTLTNNPNSLMLTAIGDCTSLSQDASSTNVTSIITNEASSIAAVWALRNFISLDGTTVNITGPASNYGGVSGVGTTTSFAGLAHAFLNANNLSPFKLGTFPQYTGDADTGTGGGLVPVQELNSLAYAQYLCTIGGDGTTPGDFTYCKTLYQLATPPGGVAPVNSLQAMLNIARYPGNNAAAILTFTLTPIPLSGQTGSQQINAGVYVPALTSFGSGGPGSATDWSVAIYYLPGYGATTTGQGSIYPIDLAIDANDSVYISNPNASPGTSGNVIALNSAGQSLWTSNTDTTKLLSPRGIAADATGHIWVVNGTTGAGTGFVQEMSATSGATIAQFLSTQVSLYGIAVDTLGNVWYDANTATGQNLHELALNGTAYSEAVFPISPNSALQNLQIRPDSKNNIWVAGYSTTNSAVVMFPNTGTAAAPTYTAGLKLAPFPGGTTTYGITLDASGNAYSAPNGTSGGIFKTTATGSGSATVLATAKVAANSAAGSRYFDTDGAGNIWYMDATTGTLIYQYLPATAVTNSYYPCYNAGTTTGTGTATSTVQVCTTGISTRQSLAIDSTGSIWIGSYGNSGGGRIVQIVGLAAPTIPLKALAKPGIMP